MNISISKVTRRFLILIILVFLTPQFIEAATYYISTSGNDSNPGTQSQPFATFNHAFSVMQGGDTLYVMDGVYHQQIKGMPSGSQGNYTKIYALNDHKVDINGQGTYPSSGWEALLYIKNKSYIEIRGLKVYNSGPNSHVLQIVDSNHIKIKVSGFWQASNDKYHYPVNITNSSEILLEDVWAFGRGRYTIVLSDNATSVTLRRVVTRWDEGIWTGEPIAGFSIYKAYNNILENTITLDHKDSGGHSAGHHGYYVVSWNSNYPESKNNKFYGNIALNLNIDGFTIGTDAHDDVDNHYIKDYVSIATYRGLNILKSNVATIENCSFINSSGGSSWSSGLFNGSGSSGVVVKNSLAIGNEGAGFHNNSGNISIFSYNGAYNNYNGNYSGLTCSTGCRTDNPNLLYPLRIESSSSYKGAGENGADIGANIVYRYENGVLTSQPLWPWPYESWIKEDMCNSDFLQQIGRTGANTPQWCATNKTLTQYIWEYLGNSCPEDICDYNDPAPSPPRNLRIQ
jgi:hypothetical protein